jgi:hypothetical protein
VTDFVNLKIKPTQSFECAHKNMLYVRMFINMNDHMNIIICIYIVFLKTNTKKQPTFVFVHHTTVRAASYEQGRSQPWELSVSSSIFNRVISTKIMIKQWFMKDLEKIMCQLTPTTPCSFTPAYLRGP